MLNSTSATSRLVDGLQIEEKRGQKGVGERGRRDAEKDHNKGEEGRGQGTSGAGTVFSDESRGQAKLEEARGQYQGKLGTVYGW